MLISEIWRHNCLNGRFHLSPEWVIRSLKAALNAAPGWVEDRGAGQGCYRGLQAQSRPASTRYWRAASTSQSRKAPRAADSSLRSGMIR